MKFKINLIPLTAIIAMAMTAISVNSQNFSGPRSMGPTLNTASNDLNGVISPNGLSFYFSSNRTVGSQGLTDIWVSQRTTLNSAWGSPQNLGATVNGPSNEAIGSLSIDGKTMFLQSNRPGGFGLRDNYISTRTDTSNDFGWTTPLNLGAVVNSASDELAATYFEDQSTGVSSIIFSSDRVGTPGFNYHFYQSTRNADGTFNTPTLINELNGPQADTRATVRRDGLEIFITSGRPGGVATGQLDIWVSNRATTTSAWSTPVLVPGISTAVDEGSVSLSPDGSILYVTSLRDGGAGLADLYSATRCSSYAASPCGVNRTVADFNGDGQTDLSVFRPSEGNWYILESGTNTIRVQTFGTIGDKIVPGDYDGDGRTDMAVFRPSTANWWILRSSDNTYYAINWGLSADQLVPADYDGDGKTDIGVYRNGSWYIHGQLQTQQFGLGSDIPVAGTRTQ